MKPEQKTTLFLCKRLERLRLKIDRLFPLMRGSVVSIGMVNKRPNYSLNMNGKTKMISLGHGKEIVARKWIDNYRKLLEVIDEMTLINIEIIRRMDYNSKKSE